MEAPLPYVPAVSDDHPAGIRFASVWGLFFRRERERRGLKQVQVAARLKLKPPTISQWESGDKAPQADSIERTLRLWRMPMSKALRVMEGCAKELEGGFVPPEQEEALQRANVRPLPDSNEAWQLSERKVKSPSDTDEPPSSRGKRPPRRSE